MWMSVCFDPADHFDPIPTPGPSDWLANHREPGQTFAQYRQEGVNRPDKIRRKLYLQPLGEFPGDTSPSREQLTQFAEAFFTLPVELRPAADLAGLPITSRMRSGTRQLLTSDILAWLQTRLPSPRRQDYLADDLGGGLQRTVERPLKRVAAAAHQGDRKKLADPS